MIKKGVFLSDIHLPFNVNLSGILKFLKDYKPDEIILGGDIIDADGTFGIDGWTADKVQSDGLPAFQRDVMLLRRLLEALRKASPKSTFIFLEGNHEERYRRPLSRYPELLKGKFDLVKEIGFNGKWIPYGDYNSFYKVGDCLFTHGTIFPDAHSKKMAMAYLPNKVVYGHIHDYQAYTTHNGDPRKPGRFALTAGCLCGRLPDYKKGQPNKWVNGFVSWVSINGCTTPTAHLIENGKFQIGGHIYE